MKKVILSASMLVGITATAQTDYDKRVGINSETPRASLEVKAVNNGFAQGILFPHIDEDEKARWTKDEAKGLVAGTVIWNITKQCLDYFDGTNWQCTDGTKTNVHPTKWTPGSSSFTGKAVWGDDAGETISVTKNNCPAGQTGNTITYPATTAQHITYTATSNVSQADADQKALALMNSAEKQQERQTLAQEYANQNGTCKNDTPDSTPVTLPAGVTIANSEHWITSILDNSYLPYTLPDAPASWTERTNPNAGIDQNIDVKGQIPAQGITVKIPITVTSGSPTLPAYKAYVTTVPEAWKDGQAKVLEFSWEAQTLATTTQTITATIKVKDATTNQELTQLDLRNGLGNDYKGILLGQFKIPKNNTETSGTTYTGTYDIRVISGIPDRKFGIETNGVLEHQFIYIPKMAPNGHLILNHNLGAEYTRIDSPHFNPAASDVGLVDGADKYAMGSLFQWGRQSDGHELIDITTMKSKYAWTDIDNGNTAFVNSKTPLMMSSNLYHTVQSRTPDYNNLYSPTGAGNPCPEGWAPYTQSFYDDFVSVHLSKFSPRASTSPDVQIWSVPNANDMLALKEMYPYFTRSYYRSSGWTNNEGQVDPISLYTDNTYNAGNYSINMSVSGAYVRYSKKMGIDRTDGAYLRCMKLK